MPLQGLTRITSRLSVFIPTTLLLLLILLHTSPISCATEFDSYIQQDHNHPRIALEASNDVDWGDGENTLETYEPTFGIGNLGRDIVGRAAQDITPLKSNIPITLNLSPGQTVYYVFDASSATTANSTNSLPPQLNPDFGLIGKRGVLMEKDALDAFPELKKRQSNGQTKTVYISANTCTQPASNGSDNAQLSLFISSSNQNPGPAANDKQVQFTEGYAQAAVDAGGNVYIGISAPNNAGPGAAWNFAVSASVDDFYFSVAPDVSAAYLLDTDSTSALLVTTNLTDPKALANDSSARDLWLRSPPPFNLLVIPDNSSSIKGVGSSYCGLSRLSLGLKINSTITTRNRGNNPKQQFAIGGLSPGTKYWAVLSFSGVANGNGTALQSPGAGRGGGQVWKAVPFTTKQDTNCKLLHNLEFCSNIAYAVPANSSSTTEELASFYEENARTLYKNFFISLQQIPCTTTSSAQYSLSRTCEDCDADYKNWLCAVTIPRCMDFTTIEVPAAAPTRKAQFIQPRNLQAKKHVNGSDVDLDAVGISRENYTVWQNTSRYPRIDSEIHPGPYNELLPCVDVCYELVKSCPASLKFSCPKQPRELLTSYGDTARWYSAQPGVLPCNWVGVDQPLTQSKANSLIERSTLWWVTLLASMVMLMK